MSTKKGVAVMNPKMLDKVRLKTGETAYIVEIIKAGQEYDVELSQHGDDYPIKIVRIEDIDCVIED